MRLPPGEMVSLMGNMEKAEVDQTLLELEPRERGIHVHLMEERVALTLTLAPTRSLALTLTRWGEECLRHGLTAAEAGRSAGW